eukprot:s4217_g7.t1
MLRCKTPITRAIYKEASHCYTRSDYASAQHAVRIVAAVYTHCHADHAGGSGVPGCREVRRRGVEAWACKFDADAIRKQNELLQESDLVELGDGDVVPIGAMAVHVPSSAPSCLFGTVNSGTDSNIDRIRSSASAEDASYTSQPSATDRTESCLFGLASLAPGVSSLAHCGFVPN